ncbi:MAG: MBL fold metallo-hydrolase [Isosphaeraceae bacterium]
MDFAWRWLCVGLAGLLVLTGSARGDDSGPRPLDIYFIDVMGGAATLIVTPEKESILIDSGWPGFEDRDPRRIVHVLKNLAGCDHLDHLVTTHWHVDHFGGVAGLAKAIEIKHFWDRGLPEDNDPDLDFPDGPKANDPLGIAYRAASTGKRTALKPGNSIAFSGSLKSLVVASGGKVMAGPTQAIVKLLRSIPSIKAAYQLHRNAATSPEDNTDPGLIANSDPAGGQFIHVSVTPDGSKFHVQIGPDGPRREIASR